MSLKISELETTATTQGPADPAPATPNISEFAEANALLNAAPVPHDDGDDDTDEAEDEESYEDIADIPLRIIQQCLWDDEAGDVALYRILHRGWITCDLDQNLWHTYQGPAWRIDIKNVSLEESFEPLICCYLRLQHHLEQTGKMSKQIENLFSTRIKNLKRSAYRLRVREAAANGKRGLGVPGDTWDQDPYRLACGNGVINLHRDAQQFLEPARPKMYLRRRTTVVLGTGGVSPELFLRTLEEIFAFSDPPPNKEEIIAEQIEEGYSEQDAQEFYEQKLSDWEYCRRHQTLKMIDFLQVLLGYALIGKVTEHIIVIFEGKGRNGKTLLVEIIQYVLQEYACTVQPELLLSSPRGTSSSAPSPDILDLQGKRLVFASETRESDAFDTSKTKRLTGGDMLVGRGLYARHQTRFVPTFLLVLLTNYKPNASAEDYAFWARVVLVPFRNSFVKNPDPANPAEHLQDPNRLDLLKKEAPQILAWMVEGAVRYQNEGLHIPDFITNATKSYRDEVDLIGQFLEDCCLFGEGLSTAASLLYRSYAAWCEKNGHRALSNKKFGERIKKRDIKSKRGNRGNFYLGVEVRDEAIPFDRYDHLDRVDVTTGCRVWV